MTYVLPQVLVYEDVQSTTSAAAHPLSALIIGGNASLVRYSQPSERPNGRLGYYDPVVDSTYSWPNRPAGGVVDQGYTKIWLQNALLEYSDNPVDAGVPVLTVSGYGNRVRSASTNWATGGTYARDAALYDRDVKPGDTVRVRYTPQGGNTTDLWTYVLGLAADQVAAVIGVAQADVANAATQGSSASASQIAGDINCVTAAVDGSAYSGLASGRVSETYTIIVLDGSAGGDFTTARLRVLSASGTDDVLSLQPAAAGSPTTIGSRHLEVTFSVNPSGACSASATSEHVSPEDLIAGQQWRVTVGQAFTAPSATSGGTYTSTADTTYIVEVVKGGLYSDSPQVRVTTTNGTDLSGPTTVTGAGISFPVGTHGVTATLGGTGLRFGDKYYVAVTGVADGPLRTLVLGHNLPTTVPAGTRVGVTLYIRAPQLELPKDRVGYAPQLNWDTTDTQLTVYAGALAYDPTWTFGGVPIALPVVSSESAGYGVVYVEYRTWLPGLTDVVGSISSASSLDDLIPGSVDPDNPLKYAVSKALANSSGNGGLTPVYYLAVSDPNDTAAWQAAIDLLVGHTDVYGIVPLTRTQAVLDLFLASVGSESTPENGAWRVLWVNLDSVPDIPVVSTGSTIPNYTAATTTDGQPCLCVFEADPNTTGHPITILRCPAGNGQFLVNGVRAGDTVRANYVGDGFGGYTYTEYTVDVVQSEDQLRLIAGPATATTVSAKVEVWRTLQPAEEAAAIAAAAGSYSNRRVRAVWPNTVMDGANEVPGYFLCAALSGLTAGVLPHQPVTKVAVAGFTSTPNTTRFNRDQLNTMGGGGVWVVAQNLATGAIYNRQAVTTAPYDQAELREEMVGRNLDSIAYRFKEQFEAYMGVTNAVASMRDEILLDVGNLINTLKNELKTTRLGGQLIDATVVRLSAHATLTDRFVLVLSCSLPMTLNNLEVHLAV